MKSILLITSCILLVLSSPVPPASTPQPSRYDDADGLSIGVHEHSILRPGGSFFNRGSEPSSGLLSALARRADTTVPHHNQLSGVPVAEQTELEPVTYVFGQTVDGNLVTSGIRSPKKLPKLAPLPPTLDLLNINTLKHMAESIARQSGTIIGSIMDDRNQIARASRFVARGGGIERDFEEERVEHVDVPTLPDERSEDYRTKLLDMIKGSDRQLRRAVFVRNGELTVLSKVGLRSRNIETYSPNVYVTYWKTNQIKLSVKSSAQSAQKRVQPKPGTYLFFEAWDDDKVILNIGHPMPNVAPLPQGWRDFDEGELNRIASDIAEKDQSGESRFCIILRQVMDDRNSIIQAIKCIRDNRLRIPSIRNPTPLTVPELPKKGTSAEEYREKLIHMIWTFHDQLKSAVYKRNQSLRELDKLEVSPSNVEDADPPYIYVTYWKTKRCNGQLPIQLLSGPNPTCGGSSSGRRNERPSTKKRPADASNPKATGGVSRPKRLMRSSGKPAQHDHNTSADADARSLAKVLHGNADTLRPQDSVSSSGSNGRGHLSTDCRNVQPVIPNSELHPTSIGIAGGQSSAHAAGDHAINIGQHCPELKEKEDVDDTFFDFKAWELSRH